jgi:hypothetical protein
MNLKKHLSLIAVTAILMFASCDNTIELEAPYKEIGVIYGLINPADTIHYVRIQKAFLGEGNALVMAQIADSTYYPDILDVRLFRIKDGVEMESFPLTRFVGPDKTGGNDFPQSPNILYKTNGEVIDRDSEYKIVVTNTQSGHLIYAQTPIVDSIRVLRPTVSELIRWSNPNPTLVEFTPTPNGKVYNLTIRFHFLEQDISSGIANARYIDWVFPNEIVNNPLNASTFRREIAGENFYKFVGEKLQPGNYYRYAGNLDFIFVAGEELLANYVSITSAITSVITTTPYYSNVTGGTGIFSSRFIQVLKDKQMDPPSVSLLQSSPYTQDLGFQ